MEPIVVDMHTKSGLLEQIRASTVTLEEAGAQTLAFLRQHIPTPRTVPLCGNSIGTDRRFLAIHLNEIEEFLHYRSVDVSTIKELARRWYPAVIAGAPRKDAGHRALDDITESVNELRFYRQTVFASVDNPAPANVVAARLAGTDVGAVPVAAADATHDAGAGAGSDVVSASSS